MEGFIAEKRNKLKWLEMSFGLHWIPWSGKPWCGSPTFTPGNEVHVGCRKLKYTATFIHRSIVDSPSYITPIIYMYMPTYL